MSINIQNAQQEFMKYTENYNLQNEHIKGKQQHSLRVMEISKQIAEGLQLSQEEIRLATLIGLLHDIARFEQYTQYHTFKDMLSVDHGDLGAEILEKDIRKYIETDRYDDIIIKAVKNHNKYKIEEGLAEKEKIFAQIVRDADKIDIFFIAAEVLWRNEKEQVEKSIINPQIKQEIDEENNIKNSKYKKIEYVNAILRMLAFMFDVNFKSSFKMIKEEQYVDRMVNRFKYKDVYTQKEILDAGEKMKQYILKKLQE